MNNNTNTPVWTRRIFKYDDKQFDTVPDSMSIDQAKKHLAMYLPELGNAVVKEEVNEGLLTVTFHKQATTKGSDGELIATLSTLPPIENLTEALFDILIEEELSLELLETHATLIEAAAEFVQANRYLPIGMIKRCCKVPAIPGKVVPIGF